MDFDEAEKIQMQYILSLLLSINPKIPNINLAFYYYDHGILEVSIEYSIRNCILSIITFFSAWNLFKWRYKS